MATETIAAPEFFSGLHDLFTPANTPAPTNIQEPTLNDRRPTPPHTTPQLDRVAVD